ncbi:MAG: zinc-ribbon domain-containing protein [Promethearchaeota archaeon]|nr:MAG: zinc-ribbon domain-containing protein [Candidatus Lokiarchaeota archaeon]
MGENITQNFICEKCGTEVVPGTQFCATCGSEVPRKGIITGYLGDFSIYSRDFRSDIKYVCYDVSFKTF